MVLVPYERYQKLTANQTTMGEENRASSNVKRKKGIDGPDRKKLGPPGSKSTQKSSSWITL